MVGVQEVKKYFWQRETTSCLLIVVRCSALWNKFPPNNYSFIKKS
jgi:hypothetical protein